MRLYSSSIRTRIPFSGLSDQGFLPFSLELYGHYDTMLKPNAKVFFSSVALFTWYESCIAPVSDNDDVKERRSHTEYVDWRKIREPIVYQPTREKSITF